MRILGLDPGLKVTGWGIVDLNESNLIHVGSGKVTSDEKKAFSSRLVEIFDGVEKVVTTYRPDEVAIEETFVNVNPKSTLKLGHARGVVMLVPARFSIKIAEYSPNRVKKSVVGTGHASKKQVETMVRTLLPTSRASSADASDALAVAICHIHYCSSPITAQLLGE